MQTSDGDGGYLRESLSSLTRVPLRFLAVPVLIGFLAGVLLAQVVLPLRLTSTSRLVMEINARAASASDAELDAWNSMLRAMEKEAREREKRWK